MAKSSTPPGTTRDKNPRQPSSRTGTTNSDDSEGLVTSNKTGTNAKGVAKKEIYMSGGLGARDPSEKHVRPLRGRERAALSRVAREADHARAIEALQKRRDEALARAAAEKTKENAEPVANFEQEVVPSSMPEADQMITQSKTLDESAIIDKIQPLAKASMLRAPGTPLAETSILALANFKRRHRQPSLLQISQPKDDNTHDDDEDEMDDFSPDDESTPFRLSKTHSHITQTPPAQESLLPPSSQRQSTASRKRKLTPPQLQVRRSQDAVSAPEFEVQTTITSQPPSPSIHEPSSPPQSPNASPTPEPTLPTLPSQTRQSQPPQPHKPQSRPHAPPPTSEETPPQPPSPSAPSPQKPPSHKPSRARKPKKNPGPSPLKPISTASLQNLLPRRKHRQPRLRDKDTFDVLSSGDLQNVSSDVDELSYHAPPLRANLGSRGDAGTGFESFKAKGKKGKGSAAAVAVKQPKAKVTKTKQMPAKTKTSVPAKVKTPAPAPATRTYGQASKTAEKPSSSSSPLSDAESVSSPPPEDTSSRPVNYSRKDGKAAAATATDKVVGMKEAHRELKTLVQKFKEVDAWELSFEEVTASSSSPADAR